jgi:tubulin polyglutamylase TTLL6/13
MQKRMLTGKKVKLTPEEREERTKENMADRDNFEKENLGKYKMIYPTKNLERMAAYEEQINAAHEDWEDFTTGQRRKFTTAAKTNLNVDTKDMALQDAVSAG